MKRKNFEANEGHCLCEDHFENSCFKMNLDNARRAGYKFVRLIQGSKPTKFKFTAKKSRPARKKSLTLTKWRNLEVGVCVLL